MKQVLNTDLFIEQNVKTPCPEEITARVKNKTGNEVNWIYAFKGTDDIPQVNLGKEQCEENNGYEHCDIFCI